MIGEAIGSFEVLGRKTVINGRGQCKTDDDVLDLGVDVDTGEPIVASKTTGKVYRLTWHDICSLAVHAGVSIKPQDAH